MCRPLRAAVVHLEGTAGQDGRERAKFNDSDVDGNKKRAIDDVTGLPCPCCHERMYSPVAAHVTTVSGRKLLVHTCRTCNNSARDQDVAPFKIPNGRPYYDFRKGKTFTQRGADDSSSSSSDDDDDDESSSSDDDDDEYYEEEEDEEAVYQD